MQAIIRLLMQPSSFAGYAILLQALPALIAAPGSAIAWGGVLTALAAILKNEASNGSAT